MARFGMVGRLTARPGERDALLRHLLEAARMMDAAEGCELYLVGTSPEEPEVVSVMELWTSEAAHAASLDLPGVRDLIASAMPLIAGAPEGRRLEIVGGKGPEA